MAWIWINRLMCIAVGFLLGMLATGYDTIKEAGKVSRIDV